MAGRLAPKWQVLVGSSQWSPSSIMWPISLAYTTSTMAWVTPMVRAMYPYKL